LKALKVMSAIMPHEYSWLLWAYLCCKLCSNS